MSLRFSYIFVFARSPRRSITKPLLCFTTTASDPAFFLASCFFCFVQTDAALARGAVFEVAYSQSIQSELLLIRCINSVLVDCFVYKRYEGCSGWVGLGWQSVRSMSAVSRSNEQ